ncbi:group II intron reverse transcriptase/maturase [Streptomyces himalayensis]|uniref:Group II intron reverse transcriptase/maturase n=1 Tax=Streptomyces himalayensis subsp. himalayensis TaxID=2756131 RepID=A0A7W0DVF3_9ACTN|nr:group II intron reverse transcriptase/maturase [Streptomyces himalayensis]MBA2952043.1 group II intron reverse transcriptase/maturase [Streptomyces himalayensis subsp. himalayensis]
MPEPEGKLDTEAVSADVNGPADVPLEWDAVHWRAAEDDVRRLRQRIFTASKAGDLKRVRNLQKLMLRSRANTLVSVRRVTEENAGRKTAGVDGKVVLTSPGKAALADWVHHQMKPWHARPVKRVFIPKSNGKRRPLGIPVIVDRVLQARAKNALEPEWEARFEPKSYGFRPGRGCHDAIEAIYQVVKGRDPKRRWILDADLAAAFDRIDHDHLLGSLGTFPARGPVREWLKAGVMDKGELAPTDEGVPQGGVISPVLLNIVLHGMEKAAGVRYHNRSRGGLQTAPDSPVLVRYADDLVALCHSREQAEHIKARLAEWLTPRGLTFNEDKTRIVHLDEGFDFLGFNVRRYHDKIVLIKPSREAVGRIRKRLRMEMRALRGSNSAAVLKKLTPIIRGWAAYYRTEVSSEVFSALDDYMWKLTYRWARHSHPNKSRWWVVDRYYGQFNKSKQNRWVFGDRDSGAYLPKFAWTKIVRHAMVVAAASPDDPALADYWAQRRRKQSPPPLSEPVRRLLGIQKGRCAVCNELLLHADQHPQSPHQWEQWVRVTLMAIRKQHIATTTHGVKDKLRLIHSSCRRRIEAATEGQ